MAQSMHPAAVDHVPGFITEPGQADYLFNGVAIFLIVAVLVIGNLYFRLHAVPERIAHRTNKVQMEVVAVLVLISLFTHNHLYWIAGLLLAFVRIPDFTTPLYSIAQSLAKLTGRDPVTSGDPALITEEPVGPAEVKSKTGVHGEGV
ncbi:hypothetical protein [Rhizobium sullae]|uniref:Integral membrane protein n=1 Tax=Rhizobium sullae TaxID=50338 RepID=A0ABY5XJB6_RHISU|nr:hypothetical protein [Rhizobium sullae]UWU14640.1 hypothetical protein N2599_00970 [Rhizobium sullae]